MNKKYIEWIKDELFILIYLIFIKITNYNDGIINFYINLLSDY